MQHQPHGGENQQRTACTDHRRAHRRAPGQLRHTRGRTWSMVMMNVFVWRASMPCTPPMLASSSTSKRPSRMAKIVGACVPHSAGRGRSQQACRRQPAWQQPAMPAAEQQAGGQPAAFGRRPALDAPRPPAPTYEDLARCKYGVAGAIEETRLSDLQ